MAWQRWWDGIAWPRWPSGIFYNNITVIINCGEFHGVNTVIIISDCMLHSGSSRFDGTKR